MNLVIDIGNSSAKVGCFDRGSLIEKHTFPASRELTGYLQQTRARHVLISSVTIDPVEISGSLNASRVLYLDSLTPLPIRNNYSTPGTLGLDRLAAACGAWFLFPHHPSLVIDAGTCINYELVTMDGCYQGGAISPGVRMRFEAMHRLTAKLPVGDPIEEAPLTGTSTIRSLQSGVMNGTLGEMRGFIDRYTADHPGLRVILCGGDSHFFENHLKPSIFVAPDLVLMGLNSILLHNVNP
jgi:type III pantothenate kinase